MGMPTDVGIIDTMIGFPMRDTEAVYEFIKKQTKDADSKQSEFPAEYMFKQAPKQHEGDDDPVDVTLREMDKFGVERGLIGVHNDEGKRALKEHPEGAVVGVAGAAHRFRQAGRIAFDHLAGALGREVTRAEAGATGRHHDAGEAVDQPA